MEIYKNTVRFDIRLYLKSKKHIPKHRRLMLIEHLIDSIDADGMFPEELDGHDNFFEPTNEYEKKLWESCREMAKKDINDLKKSIQGGKKSAEIRKQKKIEEMISNIGNAVGKNEIMIDENFNELPDCEYFNAYKKEFSRNEITKMINWLKKVKMGKKVEYAWIGKQFRNFRYRDTGKIL